MGYTHYWSKKKDISHKAWDKFLVDAQVVIDSSPVVIQYEWDDKYKPLLTSDEIRFNGRGDDGHETFSLKRHFVFRDYRPDADEDFDFCKTAQKPYDLVVVAVLALAKHHFGNRLNVSSDGERGDWVEGVAFLNEALMREDDELIANPIVDGE